VKIRPWYIAVLSATLYFAVEYISENEGRTFLALKNIPQANIDKARELMELQRKGIDELKNSAALLQQPKLKMPEPTSDITAAQRIQDTAPSQWLAEQQTRLQQEAEEAKKGRDTAMEERKGLTDQLKDFFTGRETAEDKLRGTMDEFGVTDMNARMTTQIEQIQATQLHLNDLTTQRDGALMALGQQGIATPFITGQQARVAQAYDSRINSAAAKMGAETAYLQAQQGLLQNAMSMVGQIVDAFTYDTKMELDKYSMFLDLNKEEIGMMDVEYQRALEGQQRYWEMRYEEERADRTFVLNNMLQFGEAGISHTDSPEQAVNKINNWIRTQPTPVDIELRTIGKQLYQVVTDPNTGEVTTTLLAEDMSQFDLEAFKGQITSERQLELAGYQSQLRMVEAGYKEQLKRETDIIRGVGESSKWDESRRLAMSILSSNPLATENEVVNLIRENTNLPVGDAQRVVRESRMEQKFLDDRFLISTYGEDQLRETAKKEGFTKKEGIFGFRKTVGDIDAYLDSIITTIEAHRRQGMSDYDILRKMQ